MSADYHFGLLHLVHLLVSADVTPLLSEPSLIFSNFVPISLLVTLEMVKFFQGSFMEYDADMFDDEQNFFCRAQSTNINEELGQVEAHDEDAGLGQEQHQGVGNNPDGYLYCFRGGLRSQTVQQWLRDEGIDYPLVKGGYKAMRRFLLEELERSLDRADIVLVSGKTGTGKTRVIHRLERSVDLEGLAHHRGSTFGQLPQPQPSQIDFENTLSIARMKLLAGDQSRVYLEDEGRMIGRLLRKCDFERTLAMPPCSRSAHFAVHHLPAWPSVRGKPDRKALDGKLCTGDTPHRDQSVDNLVSGLWLGHVVPKRHAARSVTRNMLRRQVRARQLWGTDVYTEDSDLVAVLVHTGFYALPSGGAAPPPGLTELRATLRPMPAQEGARRPARRTPQA